MALQNRACWSLEDAHFTMIGCLSGSIITIWSAVEGEQVQAGDGLIWNKSLGINGSYHFYNQATSTDGGQTWTAEAPMDTLVRGWFFLPL
jgi:hypothetical protein